MDRVVWLDIVTNELKQFRHDGFDARRIPSRICCTHQDSKQTLVVRTHQQALARGRLGSCGVASAQAMLRPSDRYIYNERLDVGLNVAEHRPVGRAQSVKGSSAN